MNVLVSGDAERDILDGIAFYGAYGPDVGNYFYLSILADLQALSVFGGVHSKRSGYHCMPAKRFPFAIYYAVSDSTYMSSRFWMNGETQIGSPGD